MSEPVPSTSTNKRIQKYNANDYILSKDCLASIKNVVNSKFGINSYDLNSDFISVSGENSYGAVIQLEIIPKKVTKSIIEPIPSTSSAPPPIPNEIEPSKSKKNLSSSSKQSSPDKRNFLVIKLSPKQAARRKAMKVVDYYKREVFIYRQVLPHYKDIQLKYNTDNTDPDNHLQFKSAPIFYDSSLKKLDEFLILEDLTQKGYTRFSRHVSLTYLHCALALTELAKFHAMSFILRQKNRQLYYNLVDDIRYDNLFTDDIEPISIQFAIKYVNKTIKLIKNQDCSLFINKIYVLNKLYDISDIFHELCVELVDGDITDPYSVICHGDFWNNNVLYKYDSKTGLPKEAKIIDYQMARFATPVLDFVHYLFACTEKTLRDQYFIQFKNVYYNALADELKLYNLDPKLIYPRSIFEKHLKSHGIYGFCMAVYAMPFFISDCCDIPDLDEVSQAILDLNGNDKSRNIRSSRSTSSDGSDGSSSNNNNNNNPGDNNDDDDDSDGDDNNKPSTSKNYNKSGKNKKESKSTDNLKNNSSASDLLTTYEILNARTDPIYCARMLGIVQDLEKYDLFEHTQMLKLHPRKKRSSVL